MMGFRTTFRTVGIAISSLAGKAVSVLTLEVTSTDDATSSTSAPLKTAGGAAVAKRLYVGDWVEGERTTGTFEHLLLRGTAVVIANGNTIAAGGIPRGLHSIIDDSGAAIFSVSSTTVTEVADSDGTYSNTKDTGSSSNLYIESAMLTLQNNTGGSKTYRIVTLG